MIRPIKDSSTNDDRIMGSWAETSEQILALLHSEPGLKRLDQA